MRLFAVLITGVLVAACSTAPQPVTRSAEKQAEFNRLTAGKVAGPTMDCLPNWNARDMRVIDENTIIFEQGSNRLYVAHVGGGCPNLGQPGYAMLTKQPGGGGLCRGEIAQVVMPSSGMAVGSCVIEGFTPYARP